MTGRRLRVHDAEPGAFNRTLLNGAVRDEATGRQEVGTVLAQVGPVLSTVPEALAGYSMPRP